MTAINSELPLRPRPVATETLLGYLLRVTCENGYDTGGVVRKLFPLGKAQFNGLSTNMLHYNDLVQGMALRLRLPVEAIKKCFNDELDGLYDGHRTVADYALKQPRICLACVSEHRQIHRRWRFAHVTHCETHHQPLMSCCPACGYAFQWSPRLLEACPKCEREWHIDLVASQPLPNWLRHEGSLRADEQYQFLDALYTVAAVAMRFTDMQVTRFRSMPNDVGCMTELFEFSYRLLTDGRFRAVQLAARAKTWCENTNFQIIDERHLSVLNNQIPFEQTGYEVAEPPAFVPMTLTDSFQTRQISAARQADGITEFDWQYQLGMREAAIFLNIDMVDVFNLSEKGLLHIVLNTTTKKYRQLDMRDIDIMLANLHRLLRPKNDSLNLVSVGEMAAKLYRYKINVADIIDFIARGECAGYMSDSFDGVNLRSILMDFDEFIDVVERKFFDSLDDGVTRNIVEHFYYATHAQLAELKANFANELRDHPNGKNMICADSLRRFVGKYLVLNRWCRLRDLSVKQVALELTSRSISPSFSASYKRSFYTYEKSETLFNALAEISKNTKCLVRSLQK